MTLRAKSAVILLLFILGAACLAAAPSILEFAALPAPLSAAAISRVAPWCIVVLAIVAVLAVRRTYASRLRSIHQVLSARQNSEEVPGLLAAMPQDEVGRLAHEMSVCLRQAERDRREAQQWERDTQAAQRRVSTLIEMLPLAVLVVDEQCRIAQINRYAGRLIGWRPQEALRKPVGTLFPEPFQRTGNEEAIFQELRERLRRPARSGGGVSFRALGRSAAGVEAPYHMQVQELPGGSRTEYVFLIRLLQDDAPASTMAPARDDSARGESVAGADARPTLEPVDLSSLIESVVDEVDAALPETRRRIALMMPASVTVSAHPRSLHVVLREVLEAAFRAALPTAVINLTVTEAQESVGVMVEAPVAMDGERVGAPPPLVFASEVTRALGGILEVYDDIPGSLQIVVELQRVSAASR